MEQMDECDALVVGAGIAGASLAYRLAPHRKVIVLERESAPGHHTTGRSAASLSEALGTPVIRALTTLTRPFLASPPGGFSPVPLMRPLGWLFIARADQRAAYEEELAAARASCPTIDVLSVEEAVRRVPILRPEYVRHAFLEPNAMALDVDAIHQGYLRGMRGSGGRVITHAEVRAIERRGEAWTVETSAGRFRAPVLVNAAGAWADIVARLAGARPIGLVPKRRTAMILSAPDGIDNTSWPELDDVENEFYLKPEAGKFLASPADETPFEPCDVQPDELDVAIAIDRIERATTLKVKRVERRWAGLRSFVADRNPVIGFDGKAPGFFWLAGQGGAGIQTSAGLSLAASTLILGEAWPTLLAERGIHPADLSPERLDRPSA
ncbi:MAG: FAD-binding oxidoreductase [Alphaproteobacteria bacterium]